MTMDTVNGFMSHDHDRLDAIFEEMMKTKNEDIQKAVGLFSTFKEGLEQHIVWEEEVLFPKFEEKTGHVNTGPTEVMRQEHVMIKGHLAEIKRILEGGSPEIEEEASEMLRVLKVHNDKEENILYPMIDRIVGEAEAAEIVSKFKS